MRKIVALLMCLVLIMSSTSIYAENDKKNSKSEGMYALKVNTNNKGITSLTEGSYEEGEVLEFTVTPDEDYYLEKINVNNGEVEKLSENNYSFTMPAKKTTINFIFKKNDEKNEVSNNDKDNSNISDDEDKDKEDLPNDTEDSGEFYLKINTNNKGISTLKEGYYSGGEVIDFTVIPDNDHFIHKINVSRGELTSEVHNMENSFIMPNKNTVMTIVFRPLEPRTDYSVTDTGEKYHFGEKLTDIENSTEEILTKRDYTLEDLEYSTTYEGVRFVKGEILVSADLGISYDVIEKYTLDNGGGIVGYLSVPNEYQLYFEDKQTEEELFELVEIFENYLGVKLATLNIVIDSSEEAVVPATASQDAYERPNDTRWLNEWTDFDQGNVGGDNWGVEAIRAPMAWLQAGSMSQVNVGVLDSMFQNHNDLNFVNIFENPLNISSNHGNHVAGIIGATSDNSQGIAGVGVNSDIYGYALLGDVPEYGISRFNYKHGLATLFSQNVKLFNVSMGVENLNVPDTYNPNLDETQNMIDERNSLETFLNTYLQLGYDFLIIQAAGNDSNHPNGPTIDPNIQDWWVNAMYSNIFTVVTDQNLLDRIIIVGNLEQNANGDYAIARRSQIGERVDIFAPGINIESTIRNNGYNSMSGTSMAAPHVTGVASMVWGINPSLSGSQVKDIILNNTLTTEGTITITGGVTIPLIVPETVSVTGQSGTVFTYEILNAEATVNAASSIKGTGVTAQPSVQNTIVGQVVTGGATNNNIVGAEITVINSRTGDLTETVRSDENGMFELTLPVLLDDSGNELPYVVNIANNGFLTIQHTAFMSNPVPFLYTEMWQGSDLTIEVGGVNLVSGDLPFLYPSAFVDNNRTLVPVRAVAEELGYTVHWEHENQEIRLVSSNESQIVTMHIGSNDFTIINRFSQTGASVTSHTFLDNVTPTLKDGFTFLPIRSLAEALGFTVGWDGNTRTVIITS